MEVSRSDKNSFAVNAAIFFVRCYKASISRYLGGQCRFVPSCSDYAIECFEKFGFIRGMYKSVWRILRCNPLGGKGFDPVEDNLSHKKEMGAGPCR